jgi:hypothetical protein
MKTTHCMRHPVDLSDILHVSQRLEGVQALLDDYSQGTSFVRVFSLSELGIVEQTRDLPMR